MCTNCHARSHPCMTFTCIKWGRCVCVACDLPFLFWGVINMKAPMKATECQGRRNRPSLKTAVFGLLPERRGNVSCCEVWCVHPVIFQRTPMLSMWKQACGLHVKRAYTYRWEQQEQYPVNMMLGRLWAAMVRHICTGKILPGFSRDQSGPCPGVVRLNPLQLEAHPLNATIEAQGRGQMCVCAVLIVATALEKIAGSCVWRMNDELPSVLEYMNRWWWCTNASVPCLLRE